jgi:hypothetical protein
MTPDILKKRVMEEFNSIGLLPCLKVETSVFGELPRFFEVSHLSMRLVLDDVAAVAPASSIAAKIKRDLQRQGVELEYEIRAQWKVVSLFSDILGSCEDVGWPPSEYLRADIESGSARRWVAIHVSSEARTCIRQYLEHVPPDHRQRAIYKLLETCLNQKLSSRGEEYWNPILYPSRNIEEQDVARIVESRVDSREPELVPGM